MRNKTEKLERVKRTLQTCYRMAKDNEERQKDWAASGNMDCSFTCRMLASAYSFIAELLENDLRDE